MTEHTMLGGRYQLDQVIGRGGMAEVWRARDVRLGRDVAVKRLRVDLATDPTFQARFRREAQSAAGLNHPNIVSTYDTGEEPDEKTGIHVPYIVMELVEGHTLRDLLRTDRRILPEKALEWTMGVLDALAHSHRAGIIHRDIKPANVMLTPNGHVKVMDFGIARAVADTSATMTQTAAVIGTAQYLSPEQARGETVDSRSDIYSAGCLLYELLTGRPPFVGDSPVSVAYQHVREAPVAPSVLDPELTPEMDAVVLTSLAKDPAQRYQSAKEFRDDIARLLAGQEVTAVVPAAVAAPTAPTQVVGGPAEPAVSQTAATAVVGETAPAEEGGAVAVADEPRRRRSPLGWVIGLLVLALVGIGGYAGWTFTHNDQTTSLSVPRVLGQNQQEATSTLENSGFQVKASHENGDAATANTVVDQSPNAGQQAAKGSTVAITVNDGPSTNKVPSGLIGMTESQARTALDKAGFSSSNISVQKASADQENEHLDFTAGQVVTSNPAPGADVVPATQKVVLYLATGSSQVPNLVGYTAADATAKAQASGFGNVKTTTATTTDQSQDGKVVKQDPQPDTSAERTARITLTVGKYAASVPNVTGMSQSDAEAAIKAAGLTPAVQTQQVGNQGQDKVVLSQSPSASASAAKGATVTIVVGSYTAPSQAPATSPATSSPAPTSTATSDPSATSTSTSTSTTGASATASGSSTP